MTPVAEPESHPYDSAALFVGVRNFADRELLPVPYAVDDAVDLAFLFVFDRHVRLVRPDRVVLALSGQPQKQESRQKLEILRRAGAKIRSADRRDIIPLLRQQTALTGKNGILIVSLASHGFVRDGAEYILGTSSTVRHLQTTVSIATVLDIASRSARSLVLIDACRERLTPPTRSVARPIDTAAPPLRQMSRTRGQAIFFAAAAGQYAYDDPVRRNGVFTRAVIDGLTCSAAKPRGAVTPYTLAIYVDNSVRKWTVKHQGRAAGSTIQVSIDGDARNMPLSQCWTEYSDPEACRIARVRTKGSTVVAFKSDGSEAWRHDCGERIRKAFVEDIDADGTNEVVVATKPDIQALDADGKQIWAARETMPLRAVAVGDLFRDHRQEVVAVWGAEAPRLAIYSAEGERLSYFDVPERLDHVAIGRPTKHHAPRIVVAGNTTVMAFDPKKLSRGKALWRGKIAPRDQTVEQIEILHSDKDGKDEISVKTENGTLLLDFKGKVVARQAKHGSLQFHLLHSRRARP